MPGAGIAGFHRKAAEMALAGIYDLRIHRDEVVIPLVLKLRLFELTGLFPGPRPHVPSLAPSSRTWRSPPAGSRRSVPVWLVFEQRP